MSIASGKNLLAYNDFMRFPVSESMATEINALNLPGWLPPHDDIVLS